MPADNLGQTFRFIVEQAGGGGGGTAGSTGGGGGRGDGAAGRANRDANDFRNMMTKMVKAVDHSEKTTQSAFTKGFKSLGIQLTLGNMLKQSQIFTGTLNAIFQVIGALVDIVLAPFMPLIVKFLQKAIPRLLDFAERMANWVRGELKMLDELGLAGYIQEKLTSVMTDGLGESFRKFGAIVASSMGTITKLVISNIPTVVGISIRTFGAVVSTVVGSAIGEVGKLVSNALGGVVEWVANLIATAIEFIPNEKAQEFAKSIRTMGQAANANITALGEQFFVPLGEAASALISAFFDTTANIMESDMVQTMFDTLGTSMGTLVEETTIAALLGLDDASRSAAEALLDLRDSAKASLEPPPKPTTDVDPNPNIRSPFSYGPGYSSDTDEYAYEVTDVGTGKNALQIAKEKADNFKRYLERAMGGIDEGTYSPLKSTGVIQEIDQELFATGDYVSSWNEEWRHWHETNKPPLSVSGAAEDFRPFAAGMPGMGGAFNAFGYMPKAGAGAQRGMPSQPSGGPSFLGKAWSLFSMLAGGGNTMSYPTINKLGGNDGTKSTMLLDINVNGTKQDVETLVDSRNNTRTKTTIDLDRYTIEEAGGWMT
tara:strand:- start:747 stop:2543 length:1797 start_codon:yes stop_codon:yes gene_type:complete